MKKKSTLREYHESYDRIRHSLMKRACWLIIFILLIVTSINIPTEDYNHLPEIAGLVMASIALIFLSRSKNYKVIAGFIAIVGTIIINASYLFNENDLQFSVHLYMIITILFTFYILNRKWGLFILGINFIGIIIFLFTRYETIISDPPEINDQLLSAIAVETSICGLGIAYLINLFLNTNEQTRKNLIRKNRVLNMQYQVISKQNDDKDIMLKEIHHRVKNNLQIISSLIRLQAASQGKPVEEYDNIIGRINAMALIHEKLYQSDILTNFNLQVYLRSLSDSIMQNYMTEKNVKIELDIGVDHLSNRTVIPIALMFNELLSNSAKYAFKETKKPAIKISIRPLDDDTFEMCYHDNGRWAGGNETGFGLELIEAMTKQLDGKFRLDKSKTGTTFNFTLVEIKD